MRHYGLGHFENDVDDLHREWVLLVVIVLSFGIGLVVGAAVFGLSMIVF